MSLHRMPVPLLSRHSGSNAGLTVLVLHLTSYHEEYDNFETTNAVAVKYSRLDNIASTFFIKKPEKYLNKCLFII